VTRFLRADEVPAIGIDIRQIERAYNAPRIIEPSVYCLKAARLGASYEWG
jgi:hypothetical protein